MNPAALLLSTFDASHSCTFANSIGQLSGTFIFDWLMSTLPPIKVISANILASTILNGKYRDESFITPENFVVIDGYKIRDAFEYSLQIPTKKNGLIFKNCVFENKLSFRNYSYINKLIFDNCVFENNVALFQLSPQTQFNNNCHFKKELYLSGADTNDLTIENITLESKLTLNGNFGRTTIIKNINAVNSNRIGEIEFKTATVFKLESKNIYCSDLRIINQSRLYSEFDLLKLYTNNLTVDDVTIGLIFRIKDSEISQFYIDNLDKEANRKIEISNTSITNADLPLHMLKQTFIYGGCVIGKLRLWEKNFKGCYFSIENSTLEKLEFDKVHNEGGITFRDINIPHRCRIVMTSSNLGETDFINCKFSDAIFEFKNSKITNVFVSETDFPEIVITGDDVNHAQAQLAFGQLHTAFQKQGDTVRALEYQSREIEAHYKKLKWFITKKKPYVSFTWLNLWLNKISNDFGRNWVKASLFSIIIGILFFYSLVLSTNEYHFGFPISFNTGLMKAFFKFMNPLRFFESEALFEQHLTLSDRSYFIDFLGRVFVAYGFYQTIQAFRRYGRK